MKLEYELTVYSNELNNLTTVLNNLSIPFYIADETYDTHKTITSAVSAHMTEEDLCVLKLHIDNLIVTNVARYNNDNIYKHSKLEDINHLRYKFVMKKFA